MQRGSRPPWAAGLCFIPIEKARAAVMRWRGLLCAGSHRKAASVRASRSRGSVCKHVVLFLSLDTRRGQQQRRTVEGLTDGTEQAQRVASSTERGKGALTHHRQAAAKCGAAARGLCQLHCNRVYPNDIARHAANVFHTG